MAALQSHTTSNATSISQHAALAALVELGVLHERDGDLEHWAEQRTASLLDVRRDRLALLVAAPLAGVEDPDELLDVAALPSAAGGARVAVRRRLVESPVLSTDELTDEQAEWYRDKDGWLRIVCDECLKAAREEARAELEEAKP